MRHYFFHLVLSCLFLILIISTSNCTETGARLSISNEYMKNVALQAVPLIVNRINQNLAKLQSKYNSSLILLALSFHFGFFPVDTHFLFTNIGNVEDLVMDFDKLDFQIIKRNTAFFLKLRKTPHFLTK